MLLASARVTQSRRVLRAPALVVEVMSHCPLSILSGRPDLEHPKENCERDALLEAIENPHHKNLTPLFDLFLLTSKIFRLGVHCPIGSLHSEKEFRVRD